MYSHPDPLIDPSYRIFDILAINKFKDQPDYFKNLKDDLVNEDYYHYFKQFDDAAGFDKALDSYDVFQSLGVSADVRKSIINHEVVMEELLTNGYTKIEMKAMFGHVGLNGGNYSNRFHNSVKILNSKIVNNKPLLEYFPQYSRVNTANICTYTEGTKGYVPNDNYAAFADKLQNTLEELYVLGHNYEGVVIGGKAFSDEVIAKLDIAAEQSASGATWKNDNGDRFLSASLSEDVSEHFIKMSTDEIKNGTRKAVKLEIISKKGINIDGISRYGTNLIGDFTPNPSTNFPGPIQLEVLMNRTAEYTVTKAPPETMFLSDGTEINVLRYILEEL